MSMRPIVLALGGGGARGLAHLGVIQVFTEQRVPIAGIVGTSIGAVVASLYGAGTDLYRLVDLAIAFPWRNLLDLNLPRFGLVSGDRMQSALEVLLKRKTFQELSLPVWAVATDLETGEIVILRDGPVAPAVRASASVPGFFDPCPYNGRSLVDGGVLAGVPVEVARGMGDPVVAVDVGSAMPSRRSRHFIDVLTRVVGIMGSELDRRQVAQADLVIRPEVGLVGSAQFDQARECVVAGRKAAEQALPMLRSLMQMENPA